MYIDLRYTKRYDQYLSIIVREVKEVKGTGKKELYSIKEHSAVDFASQPEIIAARLSDPMDGNFQRKKDVVLDYRD